MLSVYAEIRRVKFQESLSYKEKQIFRAKKKCMARNNKLSTRSFYNHYGLEAQNMKLLHW